MTDTDANTNNIDWNAIDAEADANGELVLQIKLEDGTVVDNPKWAKYKTDVSNDPRMIRRIERMKEFPKIKAEMIHLMKEADAGKDEHDQEYDGVLAALTDDCDFNSAQLQALSDCLSTVARAWPDWFTRTKQTSKGPSRAPQGMTNNTNTIDWDDIDKVIEAMGQRGFTGSHWDKEAGTYTVTKVIPIPRASIRPKVVRVIQDALDEAFDELAPYVSTNTIAKMTHNVVVDDDRGLMVFVATAPDEVMKVEFEALFKGGQKLILPVGMIIEDRAQAAGKQVRKLMGKAAFLTNGKAT
jgi:hypothetical protein